MRRFWTLALTCVALAGLVSPSAAQDAPGALDGLLETFQLKAKVAPAPAFVTTSRPKAAGDFMPVGAPHPSRPVKVMTPAEVAAAEADLDASRERQQRRAGRTPPSVPFKPLKSGPKNTVQ